MPLHLNKPCNYAGQSFRSQLERDFWQELKLRERAKEVKDIEREVRYRIEVNGHHVCDYILDFEWSEKGPRDAWKRRYCDTKGGPVTAVFALKKKLMAAALGINVEVYRRTSLGIGPEKRKIPSRKLPTGRKVRS